MGHKALVAFVTIATLFLAGGSAFAQTTKGKVTDVNGLPVIGASVIEVGNTSNGVVTDIDGNFELKVASGKQLEVSCIGYVSQVVLATAEINIVLEEDSMLLDETVVIGYGSVKKSSLTSAVASMDNSSIEDRPMARAEQALQGQLAGVQVSITNAEPGADPQIRVRGTASISASSNPLYVIDGIPQSSMSGINPNDIQNIEVLKDAASSAIYGSRGSNGVIIVTTKQGKKGAPKVSFNATYGIATLEKKIDVLSSVEWMEHWIKSADQNYLALYPAGNISDDNATRLKNVGQNAPAFSGVNAVYMDDRWFNYVSEDLRKTHTYQKTDEELSLLDWQDYMYAPAETQNYNVSVSGATETTKYMYSLGYMDQDGLFPASNYKRINVRTNLQTKLNDQLTFGLNLAPSYVINTGSGRGNGKDSQAHRVLSSAPVSGPGVGHNVAYEPNIKYDWAGTSAYPKQYSQLIAPVNRRLGLQASTFLRYTPIKDLSIEGTASVNYSHSDTHNFTNNTIINSNWLTKPAGEASTAGHQTSWGISTLLQVVANYDKTFGKHNVSAMLGASQEIGGIGFSTDQQYKNLANDTITGTFAGSNTTTTPTVSRSNVTESTQDRLASFFGRLSYNYDSRYMLSASLRYDGYSRFGAKNKWGLFPSVSGGWNIANEEFFKDMSLSWWNTFKFRASYGQTGNNGVGSTAAYSTLSSTNFADELAYVAGSFGNNALGWEKTHSTDIAMDFGFFDNRIQASIDWYTKTTTDLLYSVPVPSVFGTSTTTDNLGSVYNAGLELELNTHNTTGEFKWDTSFNVSYNQNKVLQLGDTNTPVQSNAEGVWQWLIVGRPMYEIHVLECEGVWMSQKEIDDYIKATGNTPKYQGAPVKPGDLKHKDLTGEGNITDDDRVNFGSPTPDVTFGMTNRFSWKNWDASILFTAQTGGVIIGSIGRAIDRAGMGPQTNAMGWWRDAWWSEEDPGNGWVPNQRSSVKPDVDSRFLYSSDYFRIKNLTIGYNIPFKSFVQSARVYLSCENLFILDSYYHGYSPETSNRGKGGVDYGAYPSARTFTMGVNINF